MDDNARQNELEFTSSMSEWDPLSEHSRRRELDRVLLLPEG